MTVAVVAFAGLAIALDGRKAEPSQADLCEQSKAAIEEMAARDDAFPREAALRGIEQSCRQGLHVVTPGPSPEPVAQPGCQPGNEPVEPVSGRTVRPPRREGPFLAPTRGRLPATGKPVVAGVRLPQGSRCKDYWASDLPADDAIDLARRLAAAFPRTGLWPVLWSWPDEGPDAYYTPGNPARADDVDVARLLRRQARGYELTFERLARGADTLPPLDPFGELAEHTEDGDGPRVLMLVPVHRPADALTATGFTWSALIAPSEVTAVLRSWEDRFGAVLVELGPGSATVAVAAPPTAEEAGRLAVEQTVLAPEAGANLLDTPEQELTRALLAPGEPGRLMNSRSLWSFGWPD